MANIEKLVTLLKKLSKNADEINRKQNDHEFIPYDWYGGNMDDAYWGGCRDGEARLSKSILDKFFPND